MVDIRIYPYVFAKPGVPVGATDNQKWAFPKQSSLQADLKDYPEGNEMLGAEIYFSGRMLDRENYTATAKFYDDNTNQLLWSGSVTMAKPSSQGWEWWDWYRINFWIGHFQWEIFKESLIRIEVNVTGSQSKSSTVYQQVVDTRTPDPETPPTVKAKKRIELEFRDLTKFNLLNLVAPGMSYTGGGIQKLLQKQDEIKKEVNLNLPSGWVLTGLTVQSGKYLYIDVEEHGSDPFTITTGLVIIAIIAAVLIALGLMVVAWKITDTVNKKIEYNKIQEKADLVKTLIDMGIDPEVALQIIDGIDPGAGEEPGLLDEFKDIMIMGVMAVVIIMLIQQMGRTAS